MDAATIRQALRDASVDAGEKLMATWLDERYEAGKQVGEEIGKEIGEEIWQGKRKEEPKKRAGLP
ncbi:MAG: hypothetical protein IPK16_03785 [Anaerolineales bacterium]|nr:hypothetical protein [Anaerolineales bacterium]